MDAWAQRIAATADLRHRCALPQKPRPLACQRLVAGSGQPAGARAQLAQDCPAGGARQHPPLEVVLAGRRRKAQTRKLAQMVPVHPHTAGLIDLRLEPTLLPKPAQECGGAAVDELLGETLMERIRQPVLHRPRPLLELRGTLHPVAAMGEIGPGADVGDAGRQGVDVAVGAIQPGDPLGHPVPRQPPARAHEMEEDRLQQAQMGLRQGLAVVGDLTDFPQQLHPLGRIRQPADLLAPGQQQKRAVVEGIAHPHEAGCGWRCLETVDQRLEAGEIEFMVAPVEELQGLETVALHRAHDLRVELGQAVGDTEGAIGHVTAGTAGDLGHFGRGEGTHPAAVEFAQAGEGHMAQVHVQPHADGVGGHQMVHLARLIHGHLGVAGARAEGSQHHRRPAPPAADHLGQGVDVGGGEGDDGAAPRQPVEAAGAGIAQGRKARTGLDAGLGHQPSQQRADGVRAHEDGLKGAAGVQQPIGEDMATLKVGAELDLVDGDKAEAAMQRHRLDGGQHIGRIGRADALLAGDQRHLLRALEGHHPVEHLAGEQPQRKAHAAGIVGQHAFDRIVGLAGVGRP